MRKIYISYIATISILSLVYINNTSALDYSSNVGIGFTFNLTLSVSLSSSDLVIPNLVPGSTLDSNSINVSVATNAAYGYTLSATAGDSLHNDTNLTHTNNTDIFSSIAIDADLTSLDTDNTWGYTSKLSNETTWGNYNGLSSSNNTVLLDNSNAADSTGSVDFKISAKASSTQPSGEYTGTINFIVVSKVAPMSLLDSFIASGAEQLNGYYKMQDMTHDICNNVDIEESELQLIDVRDNKVYWVAKLKDGNCWMTQNLDLDLSPSRSLTSEDTNLNIFGEEPYVDGYSMSDDIITWMPFDTLNGSMADSNDNNPSFVDDGDKYVYTSSNASDDIVYGSLHKCAAEEQSAEHCAHYKIGNYYNWPSAVASNNAQSLNSYTQVATNSICSKGWRLPASDYFKQLLLAYGIENDNYATHGANVIRARPLYFIRSGRFYGSNGPYSPYGIGKYGFYWTNKPRQADYSYFMYFSATDLQSIKYNNVPRRWGFLIRCVAS